MTTKPSLLQQIHELMMESQHWPLERLAAYQRIQLGHLVRHARQNVPFYADRLDALFDSAGNIDWQRWLDLPVLTRAELQTRRDELLSRVIPRGHTPVSEHSTSGSTGVPVRPMSTAAMATANRAAQLRSFLNLGIDLVAPAAIFGRVSNGKPVTERYISAPWNHRWLMGESRAQHVTIDQRLPPAQQLDLLEQLGTRMVFETSNRAGLLARTNMLRAKPLRLDWVQCYSQELREEDRQDICESFGARLFQIYSSNEAGLMACQCSALDGFHVNAEMMLVEILDEHNRPCAPGVRGRVVVTPFLSTALPLIRYEQSDMAAELPPCRCGSTLPRIGMIAGKQSDLLTFSNGSHHIGSIFLARLGVQDHALAVQIAQIERDAVEFRYVPKGTAGKAWEESVAALLRAELYEGLAVTFRTMEQLPLSGRGKQKVVLSLMDGSTVSGSAS